MNGKVGHSLHEIIHIVARCAHGSWYISDRVVLNAARVCHEDVVLRTRLAEPVHQARCQRGFPAYVRLLPELRAARCACFQPGQSQRDRQGTLRRHRRYQVRGGRRRRRLQWPQPELLFAQHGPRQVEEEEPGRVRDVPQLAKASCIVRVEAAQAGRQGRARPFCGLNMRE
jgi:hypothetical protein